MKKFLFDVDGVLIRLNQYYSSVLESEGFTGIVSSLNAFYNGSAGNACLIGKADPILMIKPFLENAGWTKTTEDYFMQQFEYEREFLDHEFLVIIDKLRKRGNKCYLATDQDSYRSKFLLDQLGFKKLFDGWFISNQIGHRKKDCDYWKIVTKELGSELKKNCNCETVFIDDRIENINSALKFGIRCWNIKLEEDVDVVKRKLMIETNR